MSERDISNRVELGLSNEVDSVNGLPKQLLEKETGNKLVTVQEFIDNPETLDQWRKINALNQDILFKNDVFEYIDTKFDEGKTEQRKDKRKRTKENEEKRKIKQKKENDNRSL